MSAFYIHRSASLFFLLILFLCSIPATGQTANDGPVRIVVADNPTECLSLEGIFVDGEDYSLIDGRSNTARVKFIASDGTVTGTAVPSIPLPNAASLPCDSPLSPFGMDRIALSGNTIYAVPASYRKAAVELFDRTSGAFKGLTPDIGYVTRGLTLGPDGNVWAISNSSLVNVTSGDFEEIGLGGMLKRIDTAVGHPMGFVIYIAPELALMDESGVVRWRVSMDKVADGFVSPIDIAAGGDGTVAVCAALCKFPDQATRDEYDSIRAEALAQGNEDSLFSLEESLRSNFSTGFVLLLIGSDGSLNDVVDISSPPIACAVDSSGRAHLLTQEQTAWTISILDPRMNQGFPVCTIPFGTPAIVSPNRMAAGPDGSLYWDDVNVSDQGVRWGIMKATAPSAEPFSLVSQPGSNLVYGELIGQSLSMATALAVGSQGDLWVGTQGFPFNWSTGETESGRIVSVLHVSSDGTLLSRNSPPQDSGDSTAALDLIPTLESITAVWATWSPVETPFASLSADGTWARVGDFPLTDGLMLARVKKTTSGFAGWFTTSEGDSQEDSSKDMWVSFNADLGNAKEMPRLGALGCRLLGTNPQRNELYATIDDGEVFRIDSRSLIVTGIWQNRFASGAPGHSLDDGECIPDGLAILDRERRAIICVTPEAFAQPPLAMEEEVNNAVTTVQNALMKWKESSGAYPDLTPDILDRILDPTELDLVRRAFLGGRIYGYRATDAGCYFTAWSAAADQPALLCGPTGTQTVY